MCCACDSKRRQKGRRPKALPLKLFLFCNPYSVWSIHIHRVRLPFPVPTQSTEFGSPLIIATTCGVSLSQPACIHSCLLEPKFAWHDIVVMVATSNVDPHQIKLRFILMASVSTSSYGCAFPSACGFGMSRLGPAPPSIFSFSFEFLKLVGIPVSPWSVEAAPAAHYTFPFMALHDQFQIRLDSKKASNSFKHHNHIWLLGWKYWL
ncbi:hypothetical protein VNO77_27692 [Canavalia gladiata]|uniref:Uncharacterized protein n=1 Tax=Canavalia gladiata TaxID=3824 RepID=A0AAN9Q6Q0_CANGL